MTVIKNGAIGRVYGSAHPSSLRITALLNVEGPSLFLRAAEEDLWLTSRCQVPARRLPLNARGHGVLSGVHLYGSLHWVEFTLLCQSTHLLMGIAFSCRSR